MCGFAGIAVFSGGTPPNGGDLERAKRALHHRGPDGDGDFLNQWLGLVHTRLSIIDLTDAAAQPMRDPSGRFIIVYNGEIYNFRELATTFLNGVDGVNLASDTAVLLAMYQRFGPDCLKYLNGMFAFAIVDLKERTLFLARDRFGEKPLYWLRAGQFMAFSSELDGIKALSPDFPWRVNPKAFAVYHCIGSIPPPMTIYTGVANLPPASWLRVSADGKVELGCYWSIAARGTEYNSVYRNEAEWRQGCRDSLADALRSRMVSDVPVGLFLSGGIDSSSILAIHASLGLPQIDALCIDFEDPHFSEYQLAKSTAEHYGARLHRHLVTPEGFESHLADFFSGSDQPTTDGFNTFVVSRAGAEMGVKVWLSGVGGDELFGGYPAFRRLGMAKGLSKALQAWLPAAIPGWAANWWPEHPRMGRLAQLADTGPVPLRAYHYLRSIFPQRCARRVLTPNIWDGAWDFPREVDAFYPNVPDELNSFSQATCLELQVYMGSQLLRDMDNFSMFHSIELRAPLLDHRLAELVFACPSKYKRQRGRKKPLLTGSLAIPLPDVLLRQPKRGFTFPMESWIQKNLKESFQDIVLTHENSYLWDLEEVNKIWTGYLNHKVHWSIPWVFYSMARWLRVKNVTL